MKNEAVVTVVSFPTINELHAIVLNHIFELMDGHELVCFGIQHQKCHLLTAVHGFLQQLLYLARLQGGPLSCKQFHFFSREQIPCVKLLSMRPI